MNDEELRGMIKEHEGWSNSPYKCPAGHTTIAWGWNIDVNMLPSHIAAFLQEHGYILTIHGEELLTISIERAKNACRRLYSAFDTFTKNRQAALVDFIFNVGEGTARQFKKAIAAINAGDWHEAAMQMQDSKWYYQVGNRAKTIVKMIKEG
jgi:lysozyme